MGISVVEFGDHKQSQTSNTVSEVHISFTTSLLDHLTLQIFKICIIGKIKIQRLKGMLGTKILLPSLWALKIYLQAWIKKLCIGEDMWGVVT
jgi:hypothetical protein